MLSRFKPVEVLKGRVKVTGDRSLIRRGLVTLQFAFSVFLITASLVMGRQFSFIQDKPLGFEREHVVVVPQTLTPSPDRDLMEVINDLTPDVFALAGLIVVGVALLTVTYQGVRAVQMDPVKSLRYQ